MTMSTAGEGFGQLAMIAGLAYGLGFASRQPSIIRTALRVAVTGFLAAMSFELIGEFSNAAEPSGRAAGWLAAGLAVSAVGEGFLSREGRRALALGFAALAGATVCYLVLFTSFIDMSLTGEPLRIGLAVGIVAAAAVTLRWLWSSLGALRLSVTGYVAGLTAMTVLALFCRSPSFSFPGPWWVFWGAAMLFASGGITVARRLKDLRIFRSERVTNWLAWGLYFLGQFALATLYLMV